ncbi:MAG: heavy-metal-associated domain-containing protein [Acidiferrobacter sp.]
MPHSFRSFLIRHAVVLTVSGLGLAVIPPAAYAAAPMPVAMTLSIARLKIPGMTCTNKSCATTIYLALNRLPGVMGVGVNEANQTVSVRYIARKIQPAAFLKAVRDAGYPGTLITPNRS